MKLRVAANETKRASRDIGAPVVPTDEVAVRKDAYMKSLQGLK
jgi:hypothetical protein